MGTNLPNKSFSFNKITTCLSVAFGVAVAGQSYANSLPTLEEVVVTARKKSQAESVQEVPIAMTAVSGELIDKRFVKTLTDISKLAPNVNLDSVGTTPGTANFFIRGMGLFGSIPSDESYVGVFQDGIYYGVNSGVLTSMFDVEAVEVLRGPQGTLFGRNVTGGAVVIRSRRPTDEFDLRVRTLLGSDEQREVDFSVGGALSDNVLGKIAVGYQGNGDYFENDAGSDRGESDSYYVRPIVTFKVNEHAELTLIAEHNRFESDGVVNKRVTDDLPDHQVSLDYDPEAEYETTNFIADLDWDVGKGNLRVIAGWRDTLTEGEGDLDGGSTLLSVTTIDPWTVDQDQKSFEVRYALPVGKLLDLTVGSYFFEQSIVYDESRAINGASLGGMKGVLEQTSVGVFAQGDVALTDDLTLTLGARYTDEDKDAEVASLGQCDAFGNNCTLDFPGLSKSWGFFSGYTGLKWAFSDNANLFASWTRSFRSGGFNLRNIAPSTPGPFDKEQVNAFEIGLKSQWFDKRLRINASVFHNEFDDLQRTVVIPTVTSNRQEKLNVANAEIQGVELEVSAALSETLSLGVTFGYTDASYKEDTNPDDSLDFEQLDFANVPEKNAGLSLTYMPTERLEFTGTWNYTDKQFADDANLFPIKSYRVVDAFASYTFPGEKMKVSMFGKNLTDEEYTNFGATVGPLQILWGIAHPRTYGVEFSYMY